MSSSVTGCGSRIGVSPWGWLSLPRAPRVLDAPARKLAALSSPGKRHPPDSPAVRERSPAEDPLQNRGLSNRRDARGTEQNGSAR